jgi:hypothetical protein
MWGQLLDLDDSTENSKSSKKKEEENKKWDQFPQRALLPSPMYVSSRRFSFDQLQQQHE